MSSVQEIPLSPSPQTFGVTLGGIKYNMSLVYRTLGGNGWTLDIADANNNPFVQGIPLITGVNLLEQYAYLNWPGELWVATDGDEFAVPTFDNLGSSSHLYFVVP